MIYYFVAEKVRDQQTTRKSNSYYNQIELIKRTEFDKRAKIKITIS